MKDIFRLVCFGTIIFLFVVSDTGFCSEGFFYPITVNNKSGYINSKGAVVVEPQYAYAGSFSEGYSIVAEENTYFVIDKFGKTKNKIQIDGRYRIVGVRPFKFGFAVVKFMLDSGAVFVSANGRRAFDQYFEDAKSFTEGVAAVKMNGKWGYIGLNGESVIPNIFDLAGSFSENVAHVKVGGKWGLINKNGKFLVKPRFLLAIDPHSEGLSLVIDGKQLKFVNSKGNAEVTKKINGAFNFTEGLARVVLQGKAGFINHHCCLIVFRSEKTA